MVPETVRRALRSPARSTHANIFTNGFVVRYSGSARWGSSGCGAGKAPGRPNAGGGATPADPRTGTGGPREAKPGQNRVAGTPRGVRALRESGAEVVVETGAGEASGFEDREYLEAGAGMGGRGAERW